jgi:ABC-type multidrug transport system ATPase subunit
VNVQKYRGIIGYVSQEDILLPALTVRQTIEYAARLKLPTAFSTTTIRDIVSGVIEALGLQRCENTLVGDNSNLRGVSGGERRRVSIAVELVANPRILFLDEPTSGLDTCSALHVMSTLAKLAADSPLRTYAPNFFCFKPIVIFSIHQPCAEIFSMFDKVLLLSRGAAVYFGPASEAVSTTEQLLECAPTAEFGRRSDHALNPADRLMKLEESLDDHTRMHLQRHCAQSVEAQTLDRAAGDTGASVLDGAANTKKYFCNVWQQFFVLTRRSLSCLIGSFHLVACHSFVTCLVGVLMCALYKQEKLDLAGALNRAGSMTFMLLVVAFVSISSLEQLIVERRLYVVERENGFYSAFPYLLSKLVVDLIPLRVIPIAALGSIVYLPMGLRTDDPFHYCWFIVILCAYSVCMTLMVMVIGVLLPSFGAAALVSAIFILWNFVFGGLMVQAGTVPGYLEVFRLASPFFLAFEPLMVNELDGQMCTFAPTDATGRPSATDIPLFCVQYLMNLGLRPSNFARDVALLGVIAATTLLVCWALLVSSVRIKR